VHVLPREAVHHREQVIREPEPHRVGDPGRNRAVEGLRDGACVSASPPSETASRMACSTLSDSRKATIASGTEPWQVTSNRYAGRISSTVRVR
jgi:hypothetical protein